jgi:hypothetical protein
MLKGGGLLLLLQRRVSAVTSDARAAAAGEAHYLVRNSQSCVAVCVHQSGFVGVWLV